MKNYLITGSGGSLAQEFLKKNYNAENYFYLLYNKRKPNIFNKNKNIKYLKFNFKDSRKINKFLSKKFNSKNNIDVIVNFAGSASPSKKINTLNYLDINEIYSINLFTPLLLFFFFINKHLKKKGGGRGGKILKIINISTVHKGSLYGCHYAHSKKSLDFYCYNLAKYFSHHGILINTVSPGFLDNDMFKNVKFFNKKNFLKKKINNFIKIRIKNNSVVNLINFLLNLEHKYINGKVYEIDGGY